MSKHLLDRTHYQQIFRTIYTLLSHEKADLNASCVAFNVIGAVLLNQFYGINARPVAGIAAYCIHSNPRSVVVFASEEGEHLVPSDGGFHCWIETDEWVIDFTTPLLPLMVKDRNFPDPGAKMMQRRISTAKAGPGDLVNAGDFFVHPSQEFTQFTLTEFSKVPFHRDLISICQRWYEKPPRQMKQVIGIANQSGDISRVTFSRFQVVGEW